MVRKSENKDILKTPDTDTVSDSFKTTLNGDISDVDDFGIEGMKLTLSQIPVLKLTQAMTPEVQDREFKDIYAGMFINDVTKEALGDTVSARIMRAWRCRTKFAPRESGTTQVECSCPTFMSAEGDTGSEYGLCARCMYNNFNEADHCQTQYCMIVALDDNPHDLYRIILSRTSYKVGRTVDSALQVLRNKYRNMPSYMFKITITAEEAVNRKINSRYYVYNIKVDTPKPEDFEMAEDLAAEFKDSFRMVADLRKESLERHRQMLETKKVEEASTSTTESDFAAMGESIGNELEFGTEPTGVSMSSEDVPF